jgi:FAD/FMN-containing dehydrogenase
VETHLAHAYRKLGIRARRVDRPRPRLIRTRRPVYVLGGAYGSFDADLRLLSKDATEGTMMTAPTRAATERLYANFRGQLISPGDDEYDVARAVWNGAIDRRPALIARVGGTADVVTAVRFASEQGLPVSIRGGGHSAPGFAVADGALMIDLSAMKEILVDPATRTAVAGPGLLWRELDAATQAYGLATTGGVDGTTGIAGLTLGGGLGWLDRLAGLACDNLLSAEIVTADGRVLQASDDNHGDLFWALRGGGGNFGVVTSFTYRLHPVTEVYGGLLGYTADRAAEVLQAYREISADAPDRLALYAGLVTAPLAPFVPEHLRGHRVVGLIPVYFGAAGEAARTLAPLHAVAPPVLDLTKPMSYQEVQRLADGFNPPNMHHYYTSEWLHGLDDQTLDELVATAAGAPSPSSAIVLKRMGGAAGRVPADATAFWYRDAAYHLDIHAQWAPGSPPGLHVAWARAARQAGKRDSCGGGYVNFIEADRVRAAYGANYARLAQIEAAYDPDNFFHINNNVPPVLPAGDGTGMVADA